MMLNSNIKAVCFDAFGTVVDITDKRRPYIALLKAMNKDMRKTTKDRLMREPLGLGDFMRLCGPNMTPQIQSKITRDLDAELASIKLRPELDTVWNSLRENGYKVAICSNLAASYGETLVKKLPFEPDALILSYETGHIKPEPEIYQQVCDALNMSPEAIFFTGDTKSADVDGPKAFGMEASLIDPFTQQYLAQLSPNS